MVFQYRQMIRRTVALAMYDADAAATRFDAVVQKFQQLAFSFVAIETVQIDLGIETVVAPAQFFQDVLLQSRADEAQRVFETEHLIDKYLPFEALVSVFVALGPGYRFRFSLGRERYGITANQPDFADRFSK